MSSIPDTAPLHTLADFAAFTVTGPTLLIVRPRQPVPFTKIEGVRDALEGLTERLPNITAILVDADFDISAIGEATLAKHGWVTLDTSAEAAQ